MQIDLTQDKKIYFASDQHFGVPNLQESRKREEKFIRWLDGIKKDAQVLFLMGDLFDFWHEWKYVVPKGYIRVLGKIAELKDAGIDIYFFVGINFTKHCLKQLLLFTVSVSRLCTANPVVLASLVQNAQQEIS